jgi:N-acyl-D-aspartate/D-glutamate deacylase
MGTLLRGATVVDGTGAPGRRADVAVDNGRIVEVASRSSCEFPTVDLDGLVLSPGFVDPHTHYDAQVFWDADLTPSSWHGVTTVVTGNCGFTLAPTRPDHRDIIVRTLENVEGMSVDALERGLPWRFESFPQYLREVDALPKRLNVACMIGHTALRWYVLGDDAPERAATAGEIEQMCQLLREALGHGAVGFSTSLHDHVGAFGKPVPSRAARPDELRRVAETLAECGAGTIEVALGGWFGIEEAKEFARTSGRPLTWSGRALMPPEGEGSIDIVREVVDVSTDGAPVVPQFPCRPIVNQVSLRDPFPLHPLSAGFLEILAVEPDERLALYADDGWRQRAKATLQTEWSDRIATARVQETDVHESIRNGPTLGELAARYGTTPFDVLIDLSVADGLATRFQVAVANTNEAVIGHLLSDCRCVVGLSDAGAHVSQLCDANYATYLLSYWVRERQALPLEMAIWRLTGQPAALYGLQDRGRIAPGAAADLVAFDPQRIGSKQAERVWDFPGGTDRLTAESVGVEHVWVNGTPVRSGGQAVPDAAPGRRLNAA